MSVMFDATVEIQSDNVHKYAIFRAGEPLAYEDTLRLWQRGEGFRMFFVSLLSDSPFSAFRWETPPLTRRTITRDFEFVLLNAPGIDRRPDARAFASHFTGADCSDGVVTFENLGKDATLVVPRPLARESVYGHLAAFLRGAPREQIHALWRVVGQTVEQALCDRPLWVSTAGAGVTWLHVRLDSRPKYYGHLQYKAHS